MIWIAAAMHAQPRPQHLVDIVLVLGFAVAAAGCESATAIPAGAQQVRVEATAASDQLSHAVVRAGDVYFVLDLPTQGVALAFVRSSSGGPLTDPDLARLEQNADSEGLGTELLDMSCCGNVYKRTLTAGKYAFVVLDPRAGQQAGLRPVAMAVLDVSH